MARYSADRSRLISTKSLKWPAWSDASWRLSVKLKSFFALSGKSPSSLSFKIVDSARIVVAVDRPSIPIVASFAMSERWRALYATWQSGFRQNRNVPLMNATSKPSELGRPSVPTLINCGTALPRLIRVPSLCGSNQSAGTRSMMSANSVGHGFFVE